MLLTSEKSSSMSERYALDFVAPNLDKVLHNAPYTRGTLRIDGTGTRCPVGR